MATYDKVNSLVAAPTTPPAVVLVVLAVALVVAPTTIGVAVLSTAPIADDRAGQITGQSYQAYENAMKSVPGRD